MRDRFASAAEYCKYLESLNHDDVVAHAVIESLREQAIEKLLEEYEEDLESQGDFDLLGEDVVTDLQVNAIDWLVEQWENNNAESSEEECLPTRDVFGGFLDNSETTAEAIELLNTAEVLALRKCDVEYACAVAGISDPGEILAIVEEVREVQATCEYRDGQSVSPGETWNPGQAGWDQR